MKLKVIAFDLDGTLVQDRSSWTKLHRHFGVEEAARSNMPLYEDGKIDYQEFMRRDIALWPRNIRAKDIDLLLSDFVLNPQAPGVISDIRKMGYEVAIVSAGIDLLADKVAKTLGVGTVIANGLQTDSQGYLTGQGIFRVDLLHKDVALENVLKNIGVAMRQCMAVGDSKYDIIFLQRAGYGAAMGDDPDLLRAATFVIGDLPEVLHCIKLIEAKPQVAN